MNRLICRESVAVLSGCPQFGASIAMAIIKGRIPPVTDFYKFGTVGYLGLSRISPELIQIFTAYS